MGSPRIDRLQNAIINAPMEQWQRVLGATTTVNTATPQGAYTADRFLYGTSGATNKNFTIVRDTDVPSFIGTGNHPPLFSYKFACSTAITSPASGDLVIPWQYRMEGYDYAPFHGNAATLSFWVKITSTAAFPLTVPVAFSNGSRSYVTTVSVAANNTWQQCFVNLTFETGTAGYNFDVSLGIKITIGAGAVGSTLLAGSQNTWSVGDFFSVAGAFNSMGVNTNVMRIAAPQMVLGTLSSLQFCRAGKSAAHELLMCQRYCEVWSGLSAGQGMGNGAYSTVTNGVIVVAFATSKRAFPTVSFTNVTSFRMNNASVNNRVISVSSIQSTLTNTTMNLVGTATTNGTPIANFDCDNANGAGVMTVDAEL